MGNIIFGLTGIMGSGKSSAAKIFHKLGANIIDADELSKFIFTPDYKDFNIIKNELEKTFSPISKSLNLKLFSENQLDRKNLAQIVFSDKKYLYQLNSIIHPRIHGLFLQRIQNIQGIVIYDVPLLFENKMENMFCKTIVVYAPEKICIERAVSRTRDHPDNIKKRIRNQISIETKRKKADYLIDNSYGLDNLHRNVERVWRLLKHDYEKNICIKSDDKKNYSS